MDKQMEEKIQSCSGNDGCAPDLSDGKAVADKVRQVQVSKGLLEVTHIIQCECKQEFVMEHFEESCPNCNMTFAVTPCSSHDIKNVKAAGIGY